MTKTSVILGIIASTSVLCQWFVLQSVRKYLLQKPERMSRRVAYPVLMAFGPIAIVALRLEFGTEIFPPGTFSRQLASVIVFSYLGLVILFSLFFLMVRVIDSLIKINDAMFQSVGTGRGLRSGRGSQTGCISCSCLARDEDRERICSDRMFGTNAGLCWIPAYAGMTKTPGSPSSHGTRKSRRAIFR